MSRSGENFRAYKRENLDALSVVLIEAKLGSLRGLVKEYEEKGMMQLQLLAQNEIRELEERLKNHTPK